MISSADIHHFREYGYTHLKSVFTPNEIQVFRERIAAIREGAFSSKQVVTLASYPKAAFIEGDVLGKHELKDLNYIIFDERILECARGLLGERLVYFGDSSIQTGEGMRGFHKDNVDRADPQ